MYGTLGTPADANIPGGRAVAAGWTDGKGDLWLFGGSGLISNGSGVDYNGDTFYLNDLWEYQPGVPTPTSTTIISSPNPSVYGQAVTFTANITSSSGAPPNGNSVYFANRLSPNAQTMLCLGSAQCTTTALPVGTDSIVAVYAGDSHFAGSMSTPLSQTVSMANSFTTLTSSPNPSSFGELVTFTATVLGQFGGSATGTVTFSDGNTTLGTAPLNNGSAIFTFTALPVGTNSITAVYGGDANFVGSASTALSQTVGEANSSITLTSSPNPSSFAALVTFTATVLGQVGGTPTGTVTFSNGSATLGTAALSGGSAVFTISALPQGTDSITAVYSGDSNFAGSTSNAVSQVVTAEVAAANQWTWMGGSSTGGQSGVYGTLGTPAAGNIPGSIYEASSWTDNTGNFWLFGGFDPNGNGGYLNVLWEFKPFTNEWTWMGGSSSSTGNQPGVYGTLGTPAAVNIPGSRTVAANWTDRNGNLWLFGGWGFDANGAYGWLNDLWEYNPSTNEWVWMGGSSTVSPMPDGNHGEPGVYGTLGTPAAANTPGGRDSAENWTDRNGRLWLFGGYGYDANGASGVLNDLWEFNPSTNQWTWMGGSSTGSQSGVYGTLGTPAAGNIPGARGSASNWTDSNGNLWLFGGNGYDAIGNGGYLNDLWEFNPATNEWAWMGGNSMIGRGAGQPGVYGTLGTPAAGNIPGARNSAVSWTDASGNVWLFGGLGFGANGAGGSLNDLWEFNPSTNEWAWMSGSSTVGSNCDQYWNCGQPGVYGTLGLSAAGNVPGGRIAAANWTDSSGHLWLFGGHGFDANGNFSTLNDLWQFQPAAPPQAVVAPTFSPASGTYVFPQTVTLSTTTPGASINYTTDGSTPSNTAGTLYTGPITVSSGTMTINAVAYASGMTNSPVSTAMYTITLQATAPTFSPGGGSFTAPQTVTISDTTPGVSIKYTTDGTSPKNTPGTLYTGPITVSTTTTIKAVAYASGLADSTVSTATYKIQVVAPTFSPAGGTFITPQMVTLSTATPGASINYTTDGSAPSDTAGTLYTGPITVSANTTIKAVAYASGLTDSTVSSATYKIRAIAPTFSLGGGTFTTPQTVTLSTTTSSASINYTTDGSTPSDTAGTLYTGPITVSANTTIKAVAYASGLTDSAVSSATYKIQAIAPSFSLGGGTFSAPQTVTLSTTTPGASINYTTDGSAPSNTAGTLYTGPITVSANTTIKAVAYASDLTDSTISTATYKIQAIAPTFSPAGGTFTAPQTVTLSTTTSGASINYTTDGSAPSDTAGTLYTGPITVSATTTIKAVAYARGLTNSTVSTAKYKIGD
jgi:N-acetylneuraminic acid mutarotase